MLWKPGPLCVRAPQHNVPNFPILGCHFPRIFENQVGEGAYPFYLCRRRYYQRHDLFKLVENSTQERRNSPRSAYSGPMLVSLLDFNFKTDSFILPKDLSELALMTAERDP